MIKSVATLFALVITAHCSALTFVLKAEEKSCFYVFTETPKTNIGYYFAVQAGGAFDIDYTIKGPDDKIIVHEEKQRQGDWVFNAESVGEYEFCFSNEMSTFAEKVVDFEISIENEDTASIPQRNGNTAVDEVVSSVGNIEAKVNSILKKLHYYKTRNNRNQSTVRSTEARIFNFSILEVVFIVGMAVSQVLIVQNFFKSSRKQLV